MPRVALLLAPEVLLALVPRQAIYDALLLHPRPPHLGDAELDFVVASLPYVRKAIGASVRITIDTNAHDEIAQSFMNLARSASS